jgi:hypothetical protein
VNLHLAEVLMGEIVELEVDDDVATQEPVVENEIKEVVVAIEGETLLPGLEEEALAEFEEEFFEVADECGFEVGFRKTGSIFQAEKFEDERFFE